MSDGRLVKQTMDFFFNARAQGILLSWSDDFAPLYLTTRYVWTKDENEEHDKRQLLKKFRRPIESAAMTYNSCLNDNAIHSVNHMLK